MTMKCTFVSTTPDTTLELGRLLGERLPAGTVMTLDGDLGTGKTTLVRGLGAGLGIEEGISSPTYMLMLAYEGGRVPLYHFDAWMEGREKALLADGADEFLGSEGIAVIEWGSRVVDWLPTPRLEVLLGHRTPEERTVAMTVVGEAADPPEGVEGTLTALLRVLQRPGALEGLVPLENGDPGEPRPSPSVR